jgi:hypothetical protein
MADSDLVELFEEQAIVILDYQGCQSRLKHSSKYHTSLALINNEHLPSGRSFEDRSPLILVQKGLVSSDKNVQLEFSLSAGSATVKDLVVANDISRCRLAIIRNGPNLWCPNLKFAHPVQDGRIWDDH